LIGSFQHRLRGKITRVKNVKNTRAIDKALRDEKGERLIVDIFCSGSPCDDIAGRNVDRELVDIYKSKKTSLVKYTRIWHDRLRTRRFPSWKQQHRIDESARHVGETARPRHKTHLASTP